MVTTAKEAIREIEERAKINQETIRVIDVPHLKVGECYRQGDLYVFKIADDHPVGKPLERRQLADGESIGQRHVLLGEFQIYETIKCPIKYNDDIFEKAARGYTFDVLGECRNAHPEHAHFVFHQKGRFFVSHQVDEQTKEKVRD